MWWTVYMLVLIILLVRRLKINRFLKLSKKIKCDIKSYPLIGHAYLFAGNGEYKLKTFQRFGREAIKNGGMTGIWFGRQYYVVCVDAADAEVVLKRVFQKDYTTKYGRDLIGNGILFAPVEIWREHRKMITPMFSPKHLNSFMEIFNRQSEIMAEQVAPVVGKGAVSLWKYVNAFTLDTTCETALNVRLNCQLCSEVPFLNSFEICVKLLANRMLQPWLQFDFVYKLLPYYTRFMENKKILTNFIDEAIETKRRAFMDATKAKQNGVMSILELLIESSSHSPLELQEDLLVLLIAATDTTSVAECFTLCMLARYPNVQERVIRELQNVFGDSSRAVTVDDLLQLKYLEAVIKETLRLYPPVPITAREVVTDLELPSGVKLVKGCGVVIDILTINRNPLYWGSDAEQFRPERFLEAPLKHPAAFLSFSYGPRGCLGYKYAMMSMITFLATFLRRYSVNVENGDGKINGAVCKPMKLSYEIMLKDSDEFRVILEKREKN